MTEELHISSLVVHATRSALAHVRATIAALPGAALHGADEALGKCVVTLEGPSQRAVLDQISLIQQAEGVIAVAMVYQHAESLESMNTEIPHVDPT